MAGEQNPKLKTLLKIHHPTDSEGICPPPEGCIFIPRLFPQVDLLESEPGSSAAVLIPRSLFLTLPLLTISVTSKPQLAFGSEAMSETPSSSSGPTLTVVLEVEVSLSPACLVLTKKGEVFNFSAASVDSPSTFVHRTVL